MGITKKDFAISLAKIINYMEGWVRDSASNDHIYFHILKAKDYMLENPDYKSDFNEEYLSPVPTQDGLVNHNTDKYDKYKDKDCVVIESSHGEFYADLNTGEVIGKDICCDKQPMQSCTRRQYAQIENFDFEEWKRFYKVTIPPQLDILDLGFWLEDNRYIPAEDDYRKEVLDYMTKGDEQCQDIQT